jgi:hypothetical protein
VQITRGTLILPRKIKKTIYFEKGVERENAKRITHLYHSGDSVLLTKPGIIPKMSQPRTGPFTITQVFTNGTARIRRGAITETVNIRRLTPFFA